ncbi:MAG: hypothetical protein ACK5DE_02350 [Bacteroidota bacterium]
MSSSTGIYSGQLISSAWDSTKNQHCWVLGMTGSVNTPYIALQDIADQDVSEAGKLTGLSCAGQFEIQTAYYTGASIAVGTIVVPSSTTGSIAPYSATGQLILGSITRAPNGEGMTPNPVSPWGTGAQYAPITISPSYTGGSGSATGPGAIFYPGIDSSSVAPATVITFATAYNGTKTVA